MNVKLDPFGGFLKSSSSAEPKKTLTLVMLNEETNNFGALRVSEPQTFCSVMLGDCKHMDILLQPGGASDSLQREAAKQHTQYTHIATP